jgi:hypothetical protein
MRRFVAVLGALVLAACGEGPTADGYTFEKAEFTREQFTVTMVQYDSNREFLAAATAHGAGVEGVQAFAVVSAREPKCAIHILRVTKEYRPQWLGHELAHCMHGRWHP